MGIFDVVKVGATYHFFCHGIDLIAPVNGEIFRATSSSLFGPVTAQSIICPVTSGHASYRSAPSVIYVGGKYVMLWAGPTPGNLEVVGEMSLYLAFNDDITDDEGWVLGLSPILTITESAWDNRRVYGAFFLKENDGIGLTPKVKNGKIQIYFSGHSTGSSNQGLPGLAEVDQSLFTSIII